MYSFAHLVAGPVQPHAPGIFAGPHAKHFPESVAELVAVQSEAPRQAFEIWLVMQLRLVDQRRGLDQLLLLGCLGKYRAFAGASDPVELNDRLADQLFAFGL